MSPEEQRIAIAGACGWRRGKKQEPSFADPSKSIASDSWINPHGIPERKLPDYLNDLNAMHEAENTLDANQRLVFCSRVYEVTGSWSKATLRVESWKEIHSTAAQRAEAFLRAIGKWKE